MSRRSLGIIRKKGPNFREPQPYACGCARGRREPRAATPPGPRSRLLPVPSNRPQRTGNAPVHHKKRAKHDPRACDLTFVLDFTPLSTAMALGRQEAQ
eukprot:2896474-Prymnesium_polylepis.1